MLTQKAMEKCFKSGKSKSYWHTKLQQGRGRVASERDYRRTNGTSAELHLWLQQQPLVDFHKFKDIHRTQYSFSGNQNKIYGSGKDFGKLIDDPVLMEMGKEHGKSSAHVALAWGIVKGHPVIPKSKTEQRIKSNLESGFKLPEEDIKKIDSIDKKFRFNDPSSSFGWNFYADLDGKK